jgi:hypothetical protein
MTRPWSPTLFSRGILATALRVANIRARGFASASGALRLGNPRHRTRLQGGSAFRHISGQPNRSTVRWHQQNAVAGGSNLVNRLLISRTYGHLDELIVVIE